MSILGWFLLLAFAGYLTYSTYLFAELSKASGIYRKVDKDSAKVRILKRRSRLAAALFFAVALGSFIVNHLLTNE